MANPINNYCPRSGDRISKDALTEYRGFVVGFCNTGCRDDFAANLDKRPSDRQYFDVLIKEQNIDVA